MASNHTENWALSQWAAEDHVKREDFNADNQKVEAALTALAPDNCKLYMGSYEGTGTRATTPDGSGAVVLTFPFKPMAVFMHLDYLDSDGGIPAYHIFFRDKTESYNVTCTAKGLYLAWGENTLTLYCTSSGTASGMFNATGTTYRYLALGV